MVCRSCDQREGLLQPSPRAVACYDVGMEEINREFHNRRSRVYTVDLEEPLRDVVAVSEPGYCAPSCEPLVKVATQGDAGK